MKLGHRRYIFFPVILVPVFGLFIQTACQKNYTLGPLTQTNPAPTSTPVCQPSNPANNPWEFAYFPDPIPNTATFVTFTDTVPFATTLVANIYDSSGGLVTTVTGVTGANEVIFSFASEPGGTYCAVLQATETGTSTQQSFTFQISIP